MNIPRGRDAATTIGAPPSTVHGWVRRGSCVTPLGRFVRRVSVDSDTGCWNWTGPPNREGYGSASEHGRVWLAHRLSHTWFVGPIPPGLQVDHLCSNRICVNPDHLEAVVGLENVRRSWEGKPLAQTCRRGHPRTPENTHVARNHRGNLKRTCYACRRKGQVAA